MHKNPYKHRFIAGSSKCSTKPLSILLTKLLTHIKQGLQMYCETAYSRSGINQMWILKNSKELLDHLKSPNFNLITNIKSDTSASYLDLLLSIGRDGQLRTSLYDKRDDFNFHITNFPFLSSNIPSSPAYGVFVSQLIRYARACSSYECFILRAMRLSNKLLGQGYVKERLKPSLRKFYGRYGDLTKQYEVPLSRMLHDILDDDHIQWHPPLIGHYTNFWPLLIWTLLLNLTFFLIVQGFHRTYATGAACQQRTLTPPDTWSCPTLGLACVLMSRPISPELVLSPDFWISNTPRYFSFAFDPLHNHSSPET